MKIVKLLEEHEQVPVLFSLSNSVKYLKLVVSSHEVQSSALSPNLQVLQVEWHFPQSLVPFS